MCCGSVPIRVLVSWVRVINPLVPVWGTGPEKPEFPECIVLPHIRLVAKPGCWIIGRRHISLIFLSEGSFPMVFRGWGFLIRGGVALFFFFYPSGTFSMVGFFNPRVGFFIAWRCAPGWVFLIRSSDYFGLPLD